MTNQPTDNEWIEKARKQFWATKKEVMAVNHKFIELLTKDEFSKAILSNLPKPTEVVSPVDIDKIINDINKLYGIEEMIYQKEVKKIIKKHLKGTTPVEPINQESEVVERKGHIENIKDDEGNRLGHMFVYDDESEVVQGE